MINLDRGQDIMPYPLRFTQGQKFTLRADYEKYAQTVRQMFNNGELAAFRTEIEILLGDSDIRVMSYADTPGGISRIVAARRDQRGCLAKQHETKDSVTIYRLPSAYDIGPAIAGALAFGPPGAVSRAVFPGVTRPLTPETGMDFPEQITIRDDAEYETFPRLDAQIRQAGTIQSHWQPARKWGRHADKETLAWIDTSKGAYILSRDFFTVSPMSKKGLEDRINQLISEDVISIRAHRS
ncbi:ESX secretion-associated protein EspG [Mycobacteroides abscessus subsp. abscessus]|uniref:ESX secretion-associated protein EspG n=1 Tax=Mycobacteroides abscessus TaxID=36809 RepID=UPI0013F63A95|nr:ESX secretion-associated protein EspG [Mycobacteroides abscessus]MBN7443431.1 ESX secretion-associated protein EspG [Mycobacteroides abscessus subsp. abscessus]